MASTVPFVEGAPGSTVLVDVFATIRAPDGDPIWSWSLSVESAAFFWIGYNGNAGSHDVHVPRRSRILRLRLAVDVPVDGSSAAVSLACVDGFRRDEATVASTSAIPFSL